MSKKRLKNGDREAMYMKVCRNCEHATAISSRFGQYLCTKTGRLKKRRDTCDVDL